MEATMNKSQELYAALARVNEGAIPVMSRDRHIERKQQAALARKLFKSLGLKGISVTTPTYSMASTVEVSLPRERVSDDDFNLNGTNYRNHSYSDMPADVPAKIKHWAHCAAERKIEEILARAFPQHDDRSNTIEDYFDYCWSID